MHHASSRIAWLSHPQSPGTPTWTPPYDSHRQPAGSFGWAPIGSASAAGCAGADAAGAGPAGRAQPATTLTAAATATSLTTVRIALPPGGADDSGGQTHARRHRIPPGN